MSRRTLPILATVSLTLAATFSGSAQAAVTIESFSAATSSTLAGGHPDATTSFSFKTLFTPGEQGPVVAGGNPSEIIVNVPPGLVGNLNNVPRCPRSLFDLTSSNEKCPANTQVGIATLTIGTEARGGISDQSLGVYNVQPAPDEPGMLGIQGKVSTQVEVPIKLTASAREKYAVTATVDQVPQFPLVAGALGATLTLWAVPAAHVRGSGLSNFYDSQLEQTTIEEPIPAAPRSQWKPFVENPTDCSETPLTSLVVNTAQEPEVFTSATATSPNPTGCADVPFAPSISLTPDTSQAGAPAGVSVALTVPQSNSPEGRGTSELEKAVVTLPEGMTVSPSAASKLLEGCTNEQFDAGSDAAARCPAASVIGEDEVESPLLPGTSEGGEGKLSGKVYLGQPLSADPTSGRMFRLFQELRGFGLDVKVEGSVIANPDTGQLTATFSNLPELPFQAFKLRLDGGPNAVLVNPRTCGANTTTTQLFPYSNPTTPATPSSTFTTSYDGNGGPCPATLPFGPSSSISTASNQAGALAPLSVTFARADETQPLGRIDATLPKGLLGYVSKVQLCEAPVALAGTCGPESRVGTVSTTAGAGSDPLTVGGSVYLAHGSSGYPFMLSVVVPAVAGPYDLGNVVVPVWLQVHSDGSITAISGPLPSILDGIPLDIRSFTLTTDRPGFTFLPTNCAPLSMGGTAISLSGSVAPISAPFQASGCGSLPFAPSFTVATQGSTSTANGASLTVRVVQKPGEADIHSVHVELPKQLPSRLTTLQRACTERQFASDPAGCPPGSVVGTAIAMTPTLSVPLVGPAILVSRGGTAFPDLEVVLQGEGITVVLDGTTSIKRGVTSSTFASVPDVPISGFELNLPENPYSLLSSNGNLCANKLVIPTTIVGWNGVAVKQSTRIAVTGCAPSKPLLKVISHKVKGHTLSLVVSMPVAGRLSARGSGLGTASKKVRRGRIVTLRLALSKKASASLASHRKVGMKVRLVFSASGGPSLSTTVTFR